MTRDMKVNESVRKEAKELRGIKSTSEILKYTSKDKTTAEAQVRLANLGGDDPDFAKFKPEIDADT